MISIVPTTRDHIEQMVGERPTFTFKGYTVFAEGEIVGLGGIARTPAGYFLFSELKGQENTKYKKTLVKVAKRLVDEHGDRPLCALAESSIRGADKLLLALGFELSIPNKGLYRR